MKGKINNILSTFIQFCLEVAEAEWTGSQSSLLDYLSSVEWVGLPDLYLWVLPFYWLNLLSMEKTDTIFNFSTEKLLKQKQSFQQGQVNSVDHIAALGEMLSEYRLSDMAIRGQYEIQVRVQQTVQ